MRIDNRSSCTCNRQRLNRQASIHPNPLDSFRLSSSGARRFWNRHDTAKKSLSTSDLPIDLSMTDKRPPRHNKAAPSDADYAAADVNGQHFQTSSGRRRCRSLDCLCSMRRTLFAMATGWLHGYRATQPEEIAASDEDSAPVESIVHHHSVIVSESSQQAEQSHSPRVCTSLSWDSGYNEVVNDSPVCCSPTDHQPPCAMRMPSVVVSDCSDDPTDSGDTANGYNRLNDLPSPTLSSHSSSELDQTENNQTASWGWSPSYRTSSGGFLILPGQGSLDDDAPMSPSLLSVRRLSDCSSCSSLATLDMEPCCPGPCSAQTPSASFQPDPHQSYRFEMTTDDDESTKHDDANLPSEETCSAAKVSAWRKVRSAVQWSPFVQTFRRQRYPWVQLAGHQGNFKVGGEQGTILKKLCPKEESCFQLLMNDPLRSFIPSYKGNVTSDEGEKFLVLEDLLGEFRNPSVMDCKLGVRTYLEDELAKAKLKPKLRKDMFEKMIQVDPNAPTAEEMQLGGVTKPRYMVWRETISSTASLGFRIEGIRKQDGSSSKDFKKVGTPKQIKEVLLDFVQDHPHALAQYVERLNQLSETLARSEFFAEHELIGTSLLFVHDENKASVWMIDFAKTHQVPDGIQIDHRSPWRVGNHEDGYLIGLANLTQLLDQLVDQNQNHSTNPTT